MHCCKICPGVQRFSVSVCGFHSESLVLSVLECQVFDSQQALLDAFISETAHESVTQGVIQVFTKIAMCRQASELCYVFSHTLVWQLIPSVKMETLSDH